MKAFAMTVILAATCLLNVIDSSISPETDTTLASSESKECVKGLEQTVRSQRPDTDFAATCEREYGMKVFTKLKEGLCGLLSDLY